MPAWGMPKWGPLTPPGHSPDMLLGVVGASNQAGDQVCKEGTPQGERPPPARLWPTAPHPRGAGRDGPSVPATIGPTPAALPDIGVPADLGVPADWVAWGSPMLCPQPGRTWVLQELGVMGAYPGVSKELPPPLAMPPTMGQDTARVGGCLHIPGGCSPPTWVLRGGVGQEEASS